MGHGEHLEDALIELAQKPWTGDLNAMVQRGFVRMLTTYNPLLFSYNSIDQRGFAVELSREFERFLSGKLGEKARRLTVIPIIVPRDGLIPELLAGRGDFVAANMTITPERTKLVAFSEPFFPDVSELVVTGPAAPAVRSFDELVDVGVHLRRSSSYFEHLSRLNEKRQTAGKPPVPIDPADEVLEDYDLLEMVDVGIIPAVIVDSHKAGLWGQVFGNIRLHEDLTVNTGGNIAWAMRKESPDLLRAANEFNRVIRKGSLLGNLLIGRYLNPKWIDNVSKPEARSRFQSVSKLMQEYSDRYGFDWLMVAALGYQESKLDQSKRSPAGAVGIMQLLPSTAADPKIGINDIHLADRNVHAGVKYLNVLREVYFNDSAISALDRVLLSFAAYNAGLGNISRARAWAKKRGLDPDRWFGHVEVAAARTISREPVTYVRNIFKYYVTYKKLEQAAGAHRAAKAASKKQ
jgi:membrane-bound lytic murein transglycosylase MltF